MSFIFLSNHVLTLFLLFLSSIYREVLLISGKTCQNSNHNCEIVMTSHQTKYRNGGKHIENQRLIKVKYLNTNISAHKNFSEVVQYSKPTIFPIFWGIVKLEVWF